MSSPIFDGGGCLALPWVPFLLSCVVIPLLCLDVVIKTCLNHYSMVWWGRSIDWLGSWETLRTVGTGKGFLLLPARWGGHRRWRKHRSLAHQLLGELPWHNEDQEEAHRVLWRRQPGAVTAIPPATFGAGSPSRSPERAQRRIRARFPQGRWWSTTIREGQPWAVLQVQLGAIMRRNIEDFSLYYENLRVDQQAPIPPEAREIELRRVHHAGRRGLRFHPPRRQAPPPPDLPVQQAEEGGNDQPEEQPPEEPQRQRSRSRSRSMLRRYPQRPNRPWLMADGPGVQEDENIYVELPTMGGCYRLEIRLDDLPNADTWEEVCAHDLEWALQRTYPQLFSRQGRIGLAVNYLCLRDEEYVAPWIRRGADFMVIPSMLLGGKVGPQQMQHHPQHSDEEKKEQTQAPSARSSVSCTWASVWLNQWRGVLPPPTDTMCPAIVCLGQQCVKIQLQTTSKQMTAGELEQVARQQHPRLFEDQRVMVAGEWGTLLMQQETYVYEDHGMLVLYPSPNYGAKSMVDVPALIKLVSPIVSQHLRQQQVRLLVRGEEGLAGRLYKNQFDPIKVKQLLLEAAMKYDIQVRHAEALAGPGIALPSAAKPPKEQVKQQTEEKEKWTTVIRKPAKKSPSENKTAKTGEQGPKFELVAEEWSQPILPHFQLATHGVLLETDHTQAEKHAAQLKGTQFNVALLTVRPLDASLHKYQTTFKLKELGSNGLKRERMVTGFVNNFGPVQVKHHDQVDVVTRALDTAKTQVIMAVARKAYVTASEWAQISAISSVTQIRASIRKACPQLQLEDCFKFRQEPEQVQVLLRIQSAQLDQWLTTTELPVTCTPLGAQTQQYKVVWDRDLQSVKQVRERYAHITGYRGVVVTSKGLGARFSAESYQSARSSAGLVTGDLYTIQGLPLALPENEVSDILNDVKWSARVVEGSRRARGRSASVRVRADKPPPKELIRLSSGAEVFQLHIQSQQAWQHKEKAESQEAPTTWTQAMRVTLGRQLESAPSATGQPVIPETSSWPTQGGTFMGTAQWSVPRWQIQAEEAREFWKALERGAHFQERVEDRPFADWLSEMGCRSRGDLAVIRQMCGTMCKRIHMLLRHMEGGGNGHWVLPWATGERPYCVRCRGYGYAARTCTFLTAQCSAPPSATAVCLDQHRMRLHTALLTGRSGLEL